MGPRIERLKTRPQFLRVAATRKKWASPGLILQVKSHPATDSLIGTDGLLRVGFTVSRKVGNAVARNRAKRRLRAVADELLVRCDLGPLHHNNDADGCHTPGRVNQRKRETAPMGYDLVIIGRRTTLTRPYLKLAEDLQKALQKMGISLIEQQPPTP